MNILFLTLVGINSLSEKGIYTDLLREFTKDGHNVFVVSPTERRNHENTHLIVEEKATILRLKIGNTQKTNIIEKGISTVMIEPSFKKAIRKYFSEIKFDLIIYSTPPITLTSAVEYVKKRDGAKTYLLLKDIFPQNAVDLGMLSINGLKSPIYKHFRRQEKKLYKISDRIGCMSQANADYILKHNPEIQTEIVEVCPNSIEATDRSVDEKVRDEIRSKYGIPLDKNVFVYGGNLGKPQGVPFLIECLEKCRDIESAYFLIIGDGTEYKVLEEYVNRSGQKNVKLMKRMPKEDYDNMVGACDIGMIFLDHRFTIPNFPSRLLSYMQAKLPVLACTDTNTDIGKVIEEGEFGWWCESDNPESFCKMVRKASEKNQSTLGDNAYDYLQAYFSVNKAYTTIINSVRNGIRVE